MSGVYQRNREVSEYKFFTQAIAIRVEVNKLMASSSVVPKAYRLLNAVPTVETARSIVYNVNRADCFYPNSSFNALERKRYLTLAIADCEQLMLDMQCLMDIGLPVNANRFEALAGMVEEEIKLLKGARKNVRVTGKKTTDERTAAAQRAFEDVLMTKVAEGIKADIPDEMIEMQAHQMLEGFKQQLASQGIPFDQYTKMTGMNEEQIIMDAKEPATNQVRMDLAIRAIIKAENLEVSDEEVENEMKSVAEKYGMDLDTVKKYLRAEDVKEQVMREKVIKVVADSATAVAPEVKEEETKTEEEEEKKD
mgnify:CR=1 FL=1